MSRNQTPLTISMIEIVRNFQTSFGMNLKIMRSLYGLRSLEVYPDEKSPLAMVVDGIQAPLSIHPDGEIAHSSFLENKYDIGKVDFFASAINRFGREVCLLDIGANIGLFSRQLASKTSLIKKAVLYEPHPENFVHLKRNLTLWKANTHFVNAALSDVSGKLEFYEDPGNCGNYSLNMAAMPPNMTRITVDVLDARLEMENWLSLRLPIIYKSDTQGFDEKIASLLPVEFWSSVRVACFELWRIAKPDFDHYMFAKVLDSFPNKAFDSAPSTPVEAPQIFDYLTGTDGHYKDLLLWR